VPGLLEGEPQAVACACYNHDGDMDAASIYGAVVASSFLVNAS
jgi:hypothetical protein